MVQLLQAVEQNAPAVWLTAVDVLSLFNSLLLHVVMHINLWQVGLKYRVQSSLCPLLLPEVQHVRVWHAWQAHEHSAAFAL